METIQQYKSFCGKIFNDSKECIRYEGVSKQVNQVLSTMIASDKYNDGCSFTNGHGYIQHPKDTYIKLESKLVKLANEWFNFEKPFTCFNYYLIRYIDDSGMSCLSKLSNKLMCIDDNDREYGQPYFKLNPDKCDGGRLN